MISEWFASVLALLSSALADGDVKQTGFQGYFEGEYIRISAPQGGWLTAVSVGKGEAVPAGHVLFVLDSTGEEAAVAEAQAALAQAESQLADLRSGARVEEIAVIEAQLADADSAWNLARSTLARQQELTNKQVASPAQLEAAASAFQQADARRKKVMADLVAAKLPARPDQIASAEAGVEVARAGLRQSEWRLKQRTIASPAAGTIDDIVRLSGEWVPPSGIVISLLQTGQRKVVFFVPEANRSSLRLGEGVRVTCTNCGNDLTGNVTRVATEAEYTPPVIFSRETSAKLVWRVEAKISSKSLLPLPGQPATVILDEHD